MNWKRYLIAIVSIAGLLGAVKLVQACGGEIDPYDEYPSFFLNNVNKDPAFIPFYHTTSLNFYDEWWDAREAGFEKIPDVNLTAWMSYTGSTVLAADIDSFVYKYPVADVRNLFNHLEKSERLDIPDLMRQNTFTQWIIAHKDVDAAHYLWFAKQCEPYALSPEGYWDKGSQKWTTPVRDSAAMQEQVHEGVRQCLGSRKPMIRQRYAWQVMRMAFYSGENNQTILLFDSLVNSAQKDFMYYRCLSLKAGALFKLNRKDEAAYNYSLVFDNSDEMKKAAFTSFRWAVNDDISGALKICASNHERAVLNVMAGLYDFSNTSVEKVAGLVATAYNLDPNVKGLDIMMTREINRAEQTYMTRAFMLEKVGYESPFLTVFSVPGPEESKSADSALVRSYPGYLKTLNDVAIRIASENRVADIAYWKLTIAYIYLMQGDMNNCSKYLDMAAAGKLTDAEHDLHDIVNALYIINHDKKVSTETEEKLLPSLQWIEQRAYAQKRFAKVYTDFMDAVLCNAYLQQHDTIKAICCYERVLHPENVFGENPDYTFSFPGQLLNAMTPERLKVVQQFMQNTEKSPFEKWLTKSCVYGIDELKELEGTQYIRSHQFDKAVAALQYLPANVLARTSLPDFMISHLKDGQEWNKSDSANTYNKLQFAQKMLQLQRQLATNPKDARSAYQYANGLYSMSYYGKAHHAFDYYRSYTDDYGYFSTPERNKLGNDLKEYYGVSEPIKYYMQAFANSTDRELKARCLYLASKCRQKSCPSSSSTSGRYLPGEDDFYSYSLKSMYFKQLKDGYADTKFYSMARSSCAYFNDYVKRK